ncbi:asparagine synthase (glutamine-hydrolyzing) [Rhodomicrobium sp. Az07]|uniref:asparagine synthase (glutamine-hydrolyzing) n=1 Tax=Rhodomicrobium sp. Az07 TaxID=2839034 RepID=UPI001BE800FC|nr:asparagine synthase (glutamine-hydrolyzing) [Rhodomicrobium sp. Az07]MBT3069779.1 asparagine synthase (glutamine-hydrolyzing) [Rhodomicrobium sp. Az07]
MCGINGIFSYGDSADPVDRSELIRTRDHMAKRGPDAEGFWLRDDCRVGLGHRRLSIIDLTEAGAQPMVGADGRRVVTFNGEIYNYRDLRQRLERQGHRFQSNSDTEVLLHLYAEKGAAMVHDLRGMFAFAIWDAERQNLFLARDPYGIKPLYYADDGSTFRFASQVKALLAGNNISREHDPAGQAGFFLWGNIPEPLTLYKAIRALPAGTTLTVSGKGVAGPESYYSIARIYADAERSQCPGASDWREDFREALLDSVRHHLVADVPVGAFLSAGVDSGALVGLMRDAGQEDIQTVTLAFDEFRESPNDEAPLAETVARLYGTRHTTRRVSEAEFKADLPRILDVMDQPSIDGVNTWFVSKAAHELGLKVALSGLGGDELFGGYPSFRDVPRAVQLIGAPSRLPRFGRLARKVGEGFAGLLGLNPKLAGLAELGGTYAGAYLLRRGLFMPWELQNILGRDLAGEGLRRLAPLMRVEGELTPCPRSPHARVAILESSLYMRNQLLRDTDWASMAHSLEVRVPLVDSVLLARLAQHLIALPSDGVAFKEALAHSPSTALPSSITRRRKTGFSTPASHWISSLDTISPANSRSVGPSGAGSRTWSRIVLAGATV